MITAVLVDPLTKEVKVQKWDGELQPLYDLLGCDHVEAYDILSMGDPVTVWVDGEFWMRRENAGKERAVAHLPMCAPIAGKMLLTGPADEEGRVTDCPLLLPEVTDLIKFGTSSRGSE